MLKMALNTITLTLDTFYFRWYDIVYVNNWVISLVTPRCFGINSSIDRQTVTRW